MYVERNGLDGLGIFGIGRKLKKAAKKISYVLPQTALIVPNKDTAKGAATSLAVGGTIATGVVGAGAAGAGGITAGSSAIKVPDWLQKAQQYYAAARNIKASFKMPKDTAYDAPYQENFPPPADNSISPQTLYVAGGLGLGALLLTMLLKK